MKKWFEDGAGKRHKWAEYLMLAPDLVHLLIRLILDPDVPSKQKSKLIAVLVYFVSPIDLIPEAIVGPAGYLDDVALAAYAVNSLLNHVDEEVIRRNWAGDDDVLATVRSLLATVDQMFGAGLWTRIKSMFPQ